MTLFFAVTPNYKVAVTIRFCFTMASKVKVFLDIDIVEDEKKWEQESEEFERAKSFVKTESNKYGFSTSDILKLSE